MGDNHSVMNYLHLIDRNFSKCTDEDGNTALTLACEFSSTETVELLIKKYNADIHEIGFQGQNCFLRAAMGGRLDTMKYLHSIDENLCKGNDKRDDTALTLASWLGSKETVQFLIEFFNAAVAYCAMF